MPRLAWVIMVILYPGEAKSLEEEAKININFGGQGEACFRPCQGVPGWLRVRALSPISFYMSQHRSLRGASGVAQKRNVLKRFERMDLMKKRGQWKAERSPMGLPKTKPEA